jgi:hypothetical protein
VSDPLTQPVHAGGVDKAFGDLSVDEVRAHAAELAERRSVVPPGRSLLR